MGTTLETLNLITSSVIECLHTMTADDVAGLLDMQDFYGFGKSRLPNEFLQRLLSPYGQTPDEVQIEIVRVNRDLTKEIHFHQQATAVVVILGKAEQLPDPVGASAYLHNSWFRVSTGDRLEIPAGTLHGFTVTEGGVLYFLSVQSPPITGPGGQNDYHYC